MLIKSYFCQNAIGKLKSNKNYKSETKFKMLSNITFPICLNSNNIKDCDHLTRLIKIKITTIIEDYNGFRG